MKEVDKNLLLNTLCAMLPYGVKCCFPNIEETKDVAYTLTTGMLENFIKDVDFFLPYLRPLSTMSKKEEEELRRDTCARFYAYSDYANIFFPSTDEFYHEKSYHQDDWLPVFDWLNAHHFDYRDLIKKGLALEAPRDMYGF